MKKLGILLLCLVAINSLAAQDWKDALTKVATAAADKVTDGKLTEMALTGTWTYTAPAVKFEGGDTATELLGSAVEGTVTSRLEKAYTAIGIAAGSSSFTFNSDKTFSATLGGKALSGTYEYDASTHVITLHFAKGKFNLGSVPGHAYISGTTLSLVFPVTKLVNIATALGSKISSLATVVTVLKKYENVYVGFGFKK